MLKKSILEKPAFVTLFNGKIATNSHNLFKLLFNDLCFMTSCRLWRLEKLTYLTINEFKNLKLHSWPCKVSN